MSDPTLLESVLGVPVFATLPFSGSRSRGARRKRAVSGGRRSILARTHPHDVVIESVRGLRTRLQLALQDSRNNVIAITGPSPGVGKSFVSINLAAVLADSGKRVLLIDANLRGGWLHRCFDGERTQGLSELLSGTVELEKAIRQAPDQTPVLPARGRPALEPLRAADERPVRAARGAGVDGIRPRPRRHSAHPGGDGRGARGPAWRA